MIDIKGGKQPVTLRTDITNLQENIAWQFPFNSQVILRRILRPQNLWKLAKKQNRTESFPVNCRSARRAQHAIEGIGKRRAVLVKERRLECGIHDEVAPAKWRLSANFLQSQFLNRIKEQSPTHTDEIQRGAAIWREQ